MTHRETKPGKRRDIDGDGDRETEVDRQRATDRLTD